MMDPEQPVKEDLNAILLRTIGNIAGDPDTGLMFQLGRSAQDAVRGIGGHLLTWSEFGDLLRHLEDNPLIESLVATCTGTSLGTHNVPALLHHSVLHLATDYLMAAEEAAWDVAVATELVNRWVDCLRERAVELDAYVGLRDCHLWRHDDLTLDDITLTRAADNEVARIEVAFGLEDYGHGYLIGRDWTLQRDPMLWIRRRLPLAIDVATQRAMYRQFLDDATTWTRSIRLALGGDARPDGLFVLPAPGSPVLFDTRRFNFMIPRTPILTYDSDQVSTVRPSDIETIVQIRHSLMRADRRVASRLCWKSDGTAARSATSYAVSDAGV